MYVGTIIRIIAISNLLINQKVYNVYCRNLFLLKKKKKSHKTCVNNSRLVCNHRIKYFIQCVLSSETVKKYICTKLAFQNIIFIIF